MLGKRRDWPATNGVGASGSPRARLCACTRARRTALVFVVLLALAPLFWTLVFSNWNVCNAELDDDVDALNSAARGSSQARLRRPDKICLSPVTVDGLRLNMSIDSDDDLRR